MPTSTDPRMNPREENWGILYHEDYGFCKYEKTDASGVISDDSPLRRCCQGTALFVEKVTPLASTFYWNGIQIHWLAQGVSPDIASTGPIYQMLNKIMMDTFFSGPGKARPVAAIQGELNKHKNVDGNDINGAAFSSVFK